MTDQLPPIYVDALGTIQPFDSAEERDEWAQEQVDLWGLAVEPIPDGNVRLISRS